MIILSYDCGNINLGVCCVEYNPHWRQEFCDCLTDEQIADDPGQTSVQAYTKFINAFRIIYIDNIDTLGGKKMSETTNIERAQALKTAVAGIHERIARAPDLVLIEYQMGPNDKSRGVSYQLLYEYGSLAVEVRPVYKNKVVLTGQNINKYRIKYSTNEMANKAHARDTLLHYISYTNIALPKRKISDMADAFLQIVAYCIMCL